MRGGLLAVSSLCPAAAPPPELERGGIDEIEEVTEMPCVAPSAMPFNEAAGEEKLSKRVG
jgi:hypothetical protein